MTTTQAFLQALVSSGRAAELADADDIFGFLIGSWDLEAILHNPDAEAARSRGALHAAWVLEGRAIQDLFIFPGRRATGVIFTAQVSLTGRPGGSRPRPTDRARKLGALALQLLHPLTIRQSWISGRFRD